MIPKNKINLFDFRNIFEILSIIWHCNKGLTIARLFLIIVLAILPLIPLYLLKLLLDHFAESNPVDQPYLVLILGGFALVSILRLILSNVVGYITLLQTDIVKDHMSDLLISKSVDIDLEYFDSDKYHDTFQRAISQGDTLPLKVFNSFIQLLQNLVTLIAIGGLLITLHWSIVIILFFIALPVAFIRYKFSEKTVALRVSQTQKERSAYYYKRMLTVGDFAKEVRIFGYGQKILSKFLTLRKLLRTEKRTLYKRQTIAITISQSAESIAVIGALSIIIFRAVNGFLSVGDIALYFAAFQKGQSSINQLLKSVVQIHENRLFLKHIFDFLEIKPKIIQSQDVIEFKNPINSLELKSISFTYPGTNKKVLRDVSFSMEKGKIYALVGENGSGKTTLVKLISRLYELSDGEILLNGRDIKKYNLASLRKKITVIFQYFSRYNLNLKENISISDSDRVIDTADLKNAINLSHSKSFTDHFPKGLETMLGRLFKNGEELSGGQWQKVALARAFYKKADLIILDEPTSFIDPLAEDEIFNNLRKIGQDKILLLITHRIYNLKAVDEIFVMDKGELIEQGNHSELLAKSGTYKKMFEIQDES